MNLTKQQEENPLGFSGPRLFLIYFIGDDSTEWNCSRAEYATLKFVILA